MKITCVYKSYPIEITKEDDSEYYKCTLIGDVYSKPIKVSNESLEKVLHFYRSHINGFNTGHNYIYMEVTVNDNDQILKVIQYDPNINKVIDYKANYHFLPNEEDSLDKLIEQFKEFVNSDTDKSGTLEVNGNEYSVARYKNHYFCYIPRIYSSVYGKTLNEMKENIEKTEVEMKEFLGRNRAIGVVTK